jgi:uncharacterized protein YegL
MEMPALVMPFYVICDTSGSMRPNLTALTDSLASLVSEITRDPIVDDMVMLSIITFDDEARVVVPLAPASEVTVPSLTASGYTSYGSALRLYSQTVSEDYARLRSEGVRFFRPCVFFLTDGLPVDDFLPTFNEVIHYDPETRQGNRMYPYLIPFGFGDASAELLAALAYPNFGSKQGQAFVARDTTTGDALRSIAESIGQSIISSGLSSGSETGPQLTLPQSVRGLMNMMAIRDSERSRTAKDFLGSQSRSIFSAWAGVNQIAAARADEHGNAAGAEYDLIRDGALDGAKIVILKLVEEPERFTRLVSSLEKKGFEVQFIVPPDPALGSLRTTLAGASQLWVLSGRFRHLSEEDLSVIDAFFRSGHGVYIWGDNDPFYVDANLLLGRLLGTHLSGNTPGQQVVGLRGESSAVGLTPGHPITTGLVNIWEGITIAEVQLREELSPLIVGSNGLVVTATHDAGGCRAVVDGGFTRLYDENWDRTAGTSRYVVNAAAWLLNVERFGEAPFASGR